MLWFTTIYVEKMSQNMFKIHVFAETTKNQLLKIILDFKLNIYFYFMISQIFSCYIYNIDSKFIYVRIHLNPSEILEIRIWL